MSCRLAYYLITIAMVSVVCCIQTASANLITFDSLTGNNSDSFSSTVENGYSVTALTNGWREAHSNGNGAPSIFSAGDNEQIEIVGGFFQLLSFETDDAAISEGTSSASYNIDGFLNGSLVLSGAGAVSPEFQVNLSPDPNQTLDRLLITFDAGSTSSYNIDNIQLRAVPEPSSLLMILGIGMTTLVRRQRQAIIET